MVEISNDKLRVQINELGAELQSIQYDGNELLWQGGDEWKSRSPILFPICGRLLDGYYFYEGQKYEMNSHGFARKMFFSVEEVTKNTARLSLVSTSDTLLSYPFSFRFVVDYALVENRLSIQLTVVNCDTKKLYASIGIHPGFDLIGFKMFAGDNLEISFNEKNQTQTNSIHFNPAFVDQQETLILKQMPLDEFLLATYKADTLCFEKVNQIAISGDVGSILIDHDLTYSAFWNGSKAKPNFLCIEGWDGLPDEINTDHELVRKRSILEIEAKESYVVHYQIVLKK